MAHSWHTDTAVLIGNSDLSGDFSLRLFDDGGKLKEVVTVPGELLAAVVRDCVARAVERAYSK